MSKEGRKIGEKSGYTVYTLDTWHQKGGQWFNGISFDNVDDAAFVFKLAVLANLSATLTYENERGFTDLAYFYNEDWLRAEAEYKNRKGL